MRPKIDIHDYEVKAKMAERLLLDGGKVKVTIMFRGREITYTSYGKRLLDRISVDLANTAIVEREAKLEGKNMFLILAPRQTPLGPPRFVHHKDEAAPTHEQAPIARASRRPRTRTRARTRTPAGTPSQSREPMPKIKTHRGTAKRVKVSANGIVTHRHQFSGCGHILSKKTRKRKRNFRKDQAVFAGDLKRFAPQIPYLL